MRNLSIFIAGSTKHLKTEKSVIKGAILDLNHDYKSKGIEIMAVSSENCGQNQKKYDAIIENKADLVIFVIDGLIGEKTEKEFLLAAKNKAIKKRPDILVFFKKYEVETEEIKHCKELFNKHLPHEYPVIYENEVELNTLVEKHLRNFIEGKIDPLKKLRRWGYRHMELILSSFVLYIFVSIGYILLPNTDSPLLLIAGGGSAKNYIEKYCIQYPLSKYRGGYHVHMPSSNAWQFLEEEVITPHEEGAVRYYPVCISAAQARDESFIERTTKNDFLKVGSVVGVFLGNDTLATCIKNVPDLLAHISTAKEGFITVDDLGKIISNKDQYNVNIFTTTKGSGTRNAYDKALDGIELDQIETMYFADNSELPAVNRFGKSYVVLESECYRILALEKEIKDGHAVMLQVKDSDDSYIIKPVYLYFMAYCIDNSNKLEVPKQTLHFLDELGIDYSKKIKKGHLKRKTEDKVILQFEDLEDLPER